MKTLLILMILFPAISQADWSKNDTNRQLAFTGVLILDWAQTRYIANNPVEFEEKNTVIGKHPTLGRVNGYFASAALIHWGISYALPPGARKVWQNVSIAVEAGQVGRNIQLGIGMDF